MKCWKRNLKEILTIPKILFSYSKYTKRILKSKILKLEKAIKIQTITLINRKIVLLYLTLMDIPLLVTMGIETESKTIKDLILQVSKLLFKVNRVVWVDKTVVERKGGKKMKNKKIQLFILNRSLFNVQGKWSKYFLKNKLIGKKTTLTLNFRTSNYRKNKKI